MEEVQSSGENNTTTISQEEENFARLILLLSGISLRAVRAEFDREFHPSCLSQSLKLAYSKLNDLKIKRVITQQQWNLLFPRHGKPESKMFDVTLMMLLLTNLTKLDHYDLIPLATDTSTAADLARIKHYRNLISHNKDGNIKDIFFSTALDDIMPVVEDFEIKKTLIASVTLTWFVMTPLSRN